MTDKAKKDILNQFVMLDMHVNELIADKNYFIGFCKSAISFSNVVTQKEIYLQHLETTAALDLEYQKYIDKLCESKENILSAVNSLQNITERSVVQLYYIGKLKNGKYKRLMLWQIANELGYSEDRIKHIHINAIKHLELKEVA